MRMAIVAVVCCLMAGVMCGCYFTDYRESQRNTVTIPHGHNIDSITIKDGEEIIEVKTHKRNGFLEERNCPRQLPLVRIVEKED